MRIDFDQTSDGMILQLHFFVVQKLNNNLLSTYCGMLVRLGILLQKLFHPIVIGCIDDYYCLAPRHNKSREKHKRPIKSSQREFQIGYIAMLSSIDQLLASLATMPFGFSTEFSIEFFCQ